MPEDISGDSIRWSTRAGSWPNGSDPASTEQRPALSWHQFRELAFPPRSTYPDATRMPESPKQEAGNSEVPCRYCSEATDAPPDRPTDQAVCGRCLSALRAEAFGWLMDLKQVEEGTENT
jgi:hypothetical protein